MRLVEHEARITKMIKVYKTFLSEKPEEKRPLARHSRRWDDNIKMYIKEIGWEDVDWIHFPQDRDSGWLL
jgi:hypothetical protein